MESGGSRGARRGGARDAGLRSGDVERERGARGRASTTSGTVELEELTQQWQRSAVEA